ncbi:MAG: hypothetical protein M3Y41_12945, partial [Pseudomonadota bacterium]|nr:hypothetical protein [Pseudomonadota bacterium]
AATAWEIAIKAALGRLAFPLDRLEDVLARMGIVPLPISLAHAVAAGSLLLHLAAGLRRGEVVGLDAEHVRATPAGLRLLLVTPEGEGGEQPPSAECVVAPGADPATCPVRAVRAWLDVSACRHGPVFRKVDRWGHIEHERLGVDEVRRVLVRRANRAKLGLHKAQRLLVRETRTGRAAKPAAP